MRGRQRHRGHRYHRTMMFFGMCAAFLALGVVPSYFIASLLFSLVGRPSDLAAQIVVSGVACLLFFFFFMIFVRVRHRKAHKAHKEHHRRNLFEELAEALDKIASGNFDVMVDSAGGRNELAEKVNRMARQLSTMERMRQDFVSNVSHEIQSPLTSIRGFAELLKKEDISRGDRMKFASVIEAESRRLSRLSDNLLRLSVLDSGQGAPAMKRYRLDRQIESVLLTLEPQWSGRKIELDVSLARTTISGDEDLLGQVWINLLHNAVKFTPEGGTIAVTLSLDDEKAVISVSNTGAGISEDDMLHVFERFYKADRARGSGGSGLGLALSKKIVELHGGTISAKSEPGAGSIFTVRLPGAEIIE